MRGTKGLGVITEWAADDMALVLEKLTYYSAFSAYILIPFDEVLRDKGIFTIV